MLFLGWISLVWTDLGGSRAHGRREETPTGRRTPVHRDTTWRGSSPGQPGLGARPWGAERPACPHRPAQRTHGSPSSCPRPNACTLSSFQPRSVCPRQLEAGPGPEPRPPSPQTLLPSSRGVVRTERSGGGRAPLACPAPGRRAQERPWVCHRRARASCPPGGKGPPSAAPTPGSGGHGLGTLDLDSRLPEGPEGARADDDRGRDRVRCVSAELGHGIFLRGATEAKNPQRLKAPRSPNSQGQGWRGAAQGGRAPALERQTDGHKAGWVPARLRPCVPEPPEGAPPAPPQSPNPPFPGDVLLPHFPSARVSQRPGRP